MQSTDEALADTLHASIVSAISFSSAGVAAPMPYSDGSAARIPPSAMKQLPVE